MIEVNHHSLVRFSKVKVKLSRSVGRPFQFANFIFICIPFSFLLVQVVYSLPWGLMLPQTLLEGGADPDHGAPSAMEAIVLFKQEDKWRAKFENAPGKGKADST
jgi:hypothetical protein